MNAARRMRRRSAKIAARVAAALDGPADDYERLERKHMPQFYVARHEITQDEARDMYPEPDPSDYRRKVAALRNRR